MTNSEPQSTKQQNTPKKITSGTIFSWIFGILFIIGALGTASSSIAAAFFYLLAGLYILPPLNKLIFNKLNFILPGWTAIIITIVLISLGGLSMPKSSSTETNKQSNSSTTNIFQTSQEKIEFTTSKGEKVTIDKNDTGTVEGISRKELEDTYNNIAKTQSKFKADEYKKSLIGTKVSWTAKVDNVDTSFDGRPYINFKSGIYTTRGYDTLKKYTDLNKDTLVLISGTIEDIYDFIGVDVYLTLDSVQTI